MTSGRISARPGSGVFQSTDQRAEWTDRERGNFVPDCNFLNPAANGECGPGNPILREAISLLNSIDPAFVDGWNTREYSWDLTAGITQEIAPRVSLQVDYVRRSWGNLPATINDALTPADFDTFVYNVPQDTRLPGGGGYPLTFRDVKPAQGPADQTTASRSPTTSAAPTTTTTAST